MKLKTVSGHGEDCSCHHCVMSIIRDLNKRISKLEKQLMNEDEDKD